LISRKLAALLVGVVVVLGWTVSGEAKGPWKAQLVEAETGRPLEGVVVVAIWTARSPGLIHPRDEFHDVDEVVSDADGRIVIPARTERIPSKPEAVLRGPEIVMFKAGYGRWGFRDIETRRADLTDPYAREEAFDRAWQNFAGEGVLIVLPKLHELRERQRFVLTLGLSGMPTDRAPRLLDAVEQERLKLFPPR
jgi:hypothetical protein